MEAPKTKTYSLSEMKDKHIGPIGTSVRDEYEYELRMEVLGKMIKTTRRERNLTQEELCKLVGVQKAQISKLESSKFCVAFFCFFYFFVFLLLKHYF